MLRLVPTFKQFSLVNSYSEEELQLHIEKLHEYNEIKDVGQLLIGKLGKFVPLFGNAWSGGWQLICWT